MFGKVRSGSSATDSYLTEMLRAMLEDLLKIDRVYLAQVRIKYEKAQTPDELGWIKGARFYTITTRGVEVDALFLDRNIAIGDHTPKVKAEIQLTSEVEGFYQWEILRAFLWVTHPSISEKNLRQSFFFWDNGQQAKLELISLSKKLSRQAVTANHIDSID